MADVFISGAGPTGLAAALFLAERGIRSRIIDKRAEPTALSKAFGVNPRSLDLLESTGVTEHLLAQGWKAQRVNVWRKGRVLFGIDIGGLKHRFPFLLIHSQAKTEALLSEALLSRGIQVERGVELVGIEPGTTNRLKLKKENGETEIEAPIVLAADGAHSTVRSELGIEFPGSEYSEPWKLIDLQLDCPLPPNEANAFLFDHGAMFMLPLEGDVWRVIGNAGDLLNRLPKGTQTGKIHWESDFIIAHRVAERFQSGGVYLAGDAAHIHSPLGARGMNLGIEDAYVFANLIAAKRAEDYERLRGPVVRQVVRRVERFTGIIRGRSAAARNVRRFAPVIATVFPLFQEWIRRFALGLDHEVDLS